MNITPAGPAQASPPAATTREKIQVAARFGNDALQWGSDAVTVGTLFANSLPALESHPRALDMINLANVGANLVGDAMDVVQLRQLFRSGRATEADRRVEVAHLVVGDALPTLAAVGTLPHPGVSGALNGVLNGVQWLGIAADLAKGAYDAARRGRQGL